MKWLELLLPILVQGMLGQSLHAVWLIGHSDLLTGFNGPKFPSPIINQWGKDCVHTYSFSSTILSLIATYIMSLSKGFHHVTWFDLGLFYKVKLCHLSFSCFGHESTAAWEYLNVLLCCTCCRLGGLGERRMYVTWQHWLFSVLITW